LPESPEIYLPKQRDRHQITSLTIDEESITYLMKLPPLHRDPFYRLLICQAMQNDLRNKDLISCAFKMPISVGTEYHSLVST
jgi:PIN domain nuclease of toxin-antitoxin system